MQGQQRFEDCLEIVQRKCVGAVGLGFGGVVVDLEKAAVTAGGDGGADAGGHQLGLAAGYGLACGAAGACGGGCLDRVRTVEDDGGEAAQDGQGTHIDDKVVVAEAGAALGKRNA